MADGDDSGLFSPPTNKPYALSGKIMLGAIILLLFIVVLMICLHLYVRLHLLSSHRRRPRRRQRSRRTHFVMASFPPAVAGTGAVTNRGLPESLVKSLPVFVYSSKTHPFPMDCAVCLSEFEENEMGRIIPKCNHYFHVGCIDMWFFSHSTCPLCRSMVEPVTLSDSSVAVVFPGGCDRASNEPGSSSGSCGGEEERVHLPPVESPSSGELVVVSSDESRCDDRFRQIDSASKTTKNFVKSLSFKRILNRDKRDAVSPSGNSVTTMEELDLEKEREEETHSVARNMSVP